jgi:hypothetical protein
MAKKAAKKAATQNEPIQPVRIKKPMTAFEAAETALERLQMTNGGNSHEIRPCHPSEVKQKVLEFCETYDLGDDEIEFSYNEVGTSLKITW